MSDKLFNSVNSVGISTQIEFDGYGGYRLTEVLDADVLEAVGAGAGGDEGQGGMVIYCPIKNECPIINHCPPPPPEPAPPPAPTPKPQDPPKNPGEDGDEA